MYNQILVNELYERFSTLQSTQLAQYHLSFGCYCEIYPTTGQWRAFCSDKVIQEEIIHHPAHYLDISALTKAINLSHDQFYFVDFFNPLPQVIQQLSLALAEHGYYHPLLKVEVDLRGFVQRRSTQPTLSKYHMLL